MPSKKPSFLDLYRLLNSENHVCAVVSVEIDVMGQIRVEETEEAAGEDKHINGYARM